MPPPLTTAPAAYAQVDRLLAHTTAAGAIIHPSLHVRDGADRGRGIFATAAIECGAVLLHVPQSLAVAPEPPLADLVASGRCSRLLALALTVLHELHVREPKAPFFDLLAASPLPATPSLWADDAVAELEGTSLLPVDATAADVATSARAAFDADVLPIMCAAGDAYMPERVRRQRLFAEALAWVMSRALLGRVNYEQGQPHLWPYLRPDGPPTAANLIMLPLFDLLNTSSDTADRCAALTQLEGPQPAIEVRATRDVSAGDELLISYGQHAAAELVRTYGIAEPLAALHPPVSLEVTPFEVVAAARTSLARGGRVLTASTASARCEMLTRAGKLPVCFLLTTSSLLPVPLMSLLQVLVMSDDEVEEWQSAGYPMLGPSFLDDESLPFVAGALLGLADARLKRLPPLRALEGAADDAVAMARSLVSRERMLVDGAFKRAVMELESAEDAEEGEEEEEEEEDDDDDDDEEEDEQEDEEEEEAADEPSGKRAKTE